MQWEYLVLRLPRGNDGSVTQESADVMNKLGAAGWELVSTPPSTGYKYTEPRNVDAGWVSVPSIPMPVQVLLAFFKRPKTPDAVSLDEIPNLGNYL